MVARPYRGWKRIVAAWLALSVVALGAELIPAHACPRHGAAMLAQTATMMRASAAALGGAEPQATAGATAASSGGSGAKRSYSARAIDTRTTHHDSSPDTNRHHCTCPGECCTTPAVAPTPSPIAWQVATLVEPARSISAPGARITTEDPRLGLPFATAPPRG